MGESEPGSLTEALSEANARLQLAMSAGKLGDWDWDAATDRLTLGPRAPGRRWTRRLPSTATTTPSTASTARASRRSGSPPAAAAATPTTARCSA
jgi:hypothetical protein